jgi:hypothetical protein
MEGVTDIAAPETGITVSDRVEALLERICEELWEAEDQVRLLTCQSVIPELGMSVPLQYLVCILDVPEARRALLAALPAWREALDGLAALLEHADAVWAEDTRGWAPWQALLTAPFSVRRPCQPDLRDPDVLLVLERNSCFGGSWELQMEWLHLQGSRENQADIQRIRQMAAFERTNYVNLWQVFGGL